MMDKAEVTFLHELANLNERVVISHRTMGAGQHKSRHKCKIITNCCNKQSGTNVRSMIPGFKQEGQQGKVFEFGENTSCPGTPASLP